MLAGSGGALILCGQLDKGKVMGISNLMWVAGKVLNTDGQNLFKGMLEHEEVVAARSFLVAVLNDRILTGYSPNRIQLPEAAEYYNMLEIPLALFPQQARGVQV